MPVLAAPVRVRVLVIDDDPMSRDLLTVLLEEEGYLVASADSGDAAVARLGASDTAPDLILTDMQMPGVSGRELAASLRRACGPSTLVLAMSGSSPASKIVAHFDGFLLKPFTAKEVTAAVAAHRVASSLPPSASKPSMEDATGTLPQFASAHDLPSAVLNETVYRQLTAAMPEAQLLQMYAMCLDDTRQRIADMHIFAAASDRIQFTRQAHSIKGGSGMLGATELYRMASRLEANGLDTPNLAGPPDVNPLDELTGACDRLERILAERALASNP